jgi:fructose-bisphosphate aldolase class II
MPLVPTTQIVGDAHVRRSGAGAFNVITLEHAEAVVEGAVRAGTPVILQLSENAVRFHGGRLAPIAAACAALASAAEVPVSLHLDHVEDLSLLHQAPDHGFSSVMFDASTLPYEANVSATRAAAEWAHACGVYLEAELGEIGGKDGAHAPGVRTNPTEAVDFVTATGVDALAVAVGSSHAMTTRDARIDLQLISDLRSCVPVPLVLHGSSGVPDEGLSHAVAAGIVKVNIGTILNVAYTGAVRATLNDPAVVDPRTYLRPARAAISDVVHRLLGVLSQAHEASLPETRR